MAKPKKQTKKTAQESTQEPEQCISEITYGILERIDDIEYRFSVPIVDADIMKKFKNEQENQQTEEQPPIQQKENKPEPKPVQQVAPLSKPLATSELDYNQVLLETTRLLNDVDGMFSTDLSVTKTMVSPNSGQFSSTLPQKSVDNSALGQTGHYSNNQQDLNKQQLGDTIQRGMESTQRYLQSQRIGESKISTPFDTEKCYFEGTLDTVTGIGDGTLYYTAPQQLRIQKFIGRLEAVTNYAPTGNGSLFIENMSNQIIQYNGEIINGKLQGQGTMIDQKGSKYSGIFQNSMLNGIGMIEYSQGDILEGNFSNGLEHGIMKLKKQDKTEQYTLWNYGKLVKQVTRDEYDAQVSGVPTSQYGTMNNNIGLDEIPGILRQVHPGEQFIIEKPNFYKMQATLNEDGQLFGKLMYLDNHVNRYYSGQFDKLQVIDQLVYVTGIGAVSKRLFNGTRFAMKGLIEQNELFGEGEIRYENGDVYRGNFVKSELNGLGSVELENRTMIYKGQFANNQLTQGLVQFPSQQIQKGIFVNTALVQGQIITKRWNIKGDFKNNQLVQGVKINRLSGNEVHIIRIKEDPVGDVFQITTNYYQFVGHGVNGKPKSGTLTFLDSELNKDKQYIDFSGKIDEISGISLTGEGTFRAKNEKDQVITLTGHFFGSKLHGEGTKTINHSYQKGEFEKGILNGFGEAYNEQANTISKGWFVRGVLINGTVTDSKTQEQLMQIKQLSDGKTKLTTLTCEVLGVLSNDAKSIDGKITFTDEYKKKNGISGCTGVVMLESLEHGT